MVTARIVTVWILCLLVFVFATYVELYVGERNLQSNPPNSTLWKLVFLEAASPFPGCETAIIFDKETTRTIES